MAAAGGSVLPLQGEEGAGTEVGECSGSIYGAVEEADGRGEAGRRRGKPAAARCGQPWRRPEVGDGPDRWAPPVGGCVREGREGGGRWRATWAGSELGRDEKKGGSWAAAGLGWVVLFFFFFFKSFFKPIFSTLLNSNLLHDFLQFSPNYFKDFSKTFLNNFSNIFKFKLLHKFSQSFHNYFKDFSQIYFLRLLKSHHNQNSCIST
jgi:hypothetical protein